MEPRVTVALIFQVAAWLLGVPAAGVFAVTTYQFVSLQLAPPAAVELNSSGGALLDLLFLVPKLIAKGMSVALGGAKWLMGALSAASFCVLLFAVALYFVSKGISDGRAWARYAGLGLAGVPLLLSLLLMALTRQAIPFTASALVAGAAAFVIWSLGWRFA